MGNILIVDDDDDILTAARLLLKRRFDAVVTTNTPGRIPDLMVAHSFDAILLDMNFGPGESSGEQGFHWLTQILELDPDAVVILITAHGDMDLAVEAMKRGATDFVAKPWENEKVIATLSAAVQLRKTRSEAKSLKASNKALVQATSASTQLVMGRSSAMKDVLARVARAAPTDANVLILGENGTGKELIARALHQASQRADHVFMTVDLGAVSETLFESELFGHKKGAFTGAAEDRIGRLEAANGGTLFLDEVANLPLHLQSKLLSVLEQRRVTPLGANKHIDIDMRVIAATNMPFADLEQEDKFRQDLLFRLNTVTLSIPPLRERREDIAPIAHHFMDHYARKYGRAGLRLSSDSLTAMEAYDWPGNVRSLRHTIERATIMCDGDTVGVSDLDLPFAKSSEPRAAVGDSDAVGVPNELNLERIEERAIATALRKHQYNISRAARELGLTRAALYRRMEKHGL